ncbi:ATP-dependent Clp protease proteolytic subunit [Massilia sp. YMA4]|uniref:ATP-dependent Clp protease proteolytic subunit n=1 Tax=Massilia sp. YMA4 TaxID=1593482 RepID=UPI000DD14B3F|nr:ATP-dependent Clp protease proteolytic subunit [Massilia sp. YMA4]AXA89891.1 hypothetical protein DPH57_01070 [Massilia sp. YMA4]
MRNVELICILSLLGLASDGQAAAPVPLVRYFPPPAPNAAVIVAMQRQSALALVGAITPEAIASIMRSAQPAARLQTLYIDSPGGDVASAIRLTEFLRSHKTRVIVAGRCFSACANFVFAGAVAKDVLPGSLVGIHGSTYTYYDGTTLRFAKAYDRAAMAQWRDKDVTVAPQVARLDDMQRQFYSARQLSLTYHDVFARYEIRRAALPSASACPDYLLWALDRPLLEGMGIKGLGAVWTPRNADEARSVAIDLGMSGPQIFFGSAARLDSTCRQDETLVDKLKSWVDALRALTGT